MRAATLVGPQRQALQPRRGATSAGRPVRVGMPAGLGVAQGPDKVQRLILPLVVQPLDAAGRRAIGRDRNRPRGRRSRSSSSARPPWRPNHRRRRPDARRSGDGQDQLLPGGQLAGLGRRRSRTCRACAAPKCPPPPSNRRLPLPGPRGAGVPLRRAAADWPLQRHRPRAARRSSNRARLWRCLLRPACLTGRPGPMRPALVRRAIARGRRQSCRAGEGFPQCPPGRGVRHAVQPEQLPREPAMAVDEDIADGASRRRPRPRRPRADRQAGPGVAHRGAGRENAGDAAADQRQGGDPVPLVLDHQGMEPRPRGKMLHPQGDHSARRAGVVESLRCHRSSHSSGLAAQLGQRQRGESLAAASCRRPFLAPAGAGRASFAWYAQCRR